MLQSVGYFGTAPGAAARFAELSAGLDEAIVRYVAARPGIEPLLATMDTLSPQAVAGAVA
jgi:hypothetical protein